MLHKPQLRPGDRVLVAGGRGFVGSHIVRELIAFGCDTYVLGPRMDQDLLADLSGRYGSLEGGIEQADPLCAALIRLAPTAVVSCAAFGGGGEGLMKAGERNADQTFAINVDGLRHLLTAAREAGVGQVVWTSSTVVYGDARSYVEPRVDEGAIKRPATVYGLSKHLAEEVAEFVARREKFPVIGLRLPLVLGPGLWYRGSAAMLLDLIRAARPQARHVLAFHNEATDLMHVEDAAAAVLATLRHPGPLAPTYNINGFTARPLEIADALRARVPGFEVDFREQAPPHHFPLITDARFRADTGFVPAKDLQQLIGQMLDLAEQESR